MSEWYYHNPVQIHFGSGAIDKLPDFVSGKAVIVTTLGTTNRGISRKISKLLNSSLVAVFDNVEPNPTFETIKATYRELKNVEYDFVIAIGGGSAIDTAKGVVAIAATGNADWLADHLKHGIIFPEQFRPKRIIAIPTTAGTGSEVTMWATVWDMKEKKKYSISHPSLYPWLALLDPVLTLSLPEKETIYSGLDALSHAMESIWNKNHNPVSDSFALGAISLIHDYLPALRDDLTNLNVRVLLLRSSLFAGLAFSNTKTAIAHSISYPLTAHFGIPHGLACALPLPHLLRFNGKRAAGRIKIMAAALGVDGTSESMASEIMRLFDRLGVSPKLEDYGIDGGNYNLILKSAFTPGRADNNIVDFNRDNLINIIKDIFQ